MKVSQLKKNKDNPRQIKGEKLELLKASVGGFQKMMPLRPIIIDEDSMVLGGNMRLAAIKALGLKEIPDEWVKQVTDLTADEKKEFIIKDNAGFGEWDWDAIANEWSDLPLADWGLDVPGFEAIEPEGDADAEPQIDKAAELNKKWKVKSGDLWQIGEHRLLCGSCTDKQSVERLTGGEQMNVCLTDPPYGLDETKDSGKNDYDQYDDSKQNLALLAAQWLPIACDISPVVVFSPGVTNAWMYPEANWIMCWFYGGGQLRSSWGFNCWQPFLCYGKDPSLASGNGGRPDAVDMNTPANAQDIDHPCPKPMKLWEWFIHRLSFSNTDNLYEPFAGSGTTLVACQNLNRKCYAIEISESYCAVILERMQTAFPDIEIKRIEQAGAANG
jgi:hypothetical protein